MTSTNPEWVKEFDEFLLGSIEDGLRIPRTRDEWIAFISRLLTSQKEEAVREVAALIANAGANRVSLKSDKDFTGTYWVSANDLYFYITGRHLNDDFDNNVIPRNKIMDDVAAPRSNEAE